jgi:hypothetical protein
VGANLHGLVKRDLNLIADRPLPEGSVSKDEAESRRQKKDLVLHILLLMGARF